jgi:hypothetical protein
MKKHLKASYEPLLEEPWALDMDATVKPLYGHQEGAQLGYNPSKPGRPSHVYHSYFIGNLRVVLEVEVQAGNQTASSFAQPELWRLLDGLPEPSRPAFLRGDCNWGTERAMPDPRADGEPAKCPESLCPMRVCPPLGRRTFRLLREHYVSFIAPTDSFASHSELSSTSVSPR